MRVSLLWILCGLVLTASCRWNNDRPGIPPKHVVLVTVEGLRADHCSAYLYPRDTTIFHLDDTANLMGRGLTLDHLAESGVQFRHASATSGDPDLSLASVLWGARPLEALNGVPSAPTLAERFQDAGFLCAGFVSRPREPLPAEWIEGFDTFVEEPTDLGALGAAITFGADLDWGTGQGVFLWLHLSSPAWPYEPPSFPNNFLDQEIDYAELYQDDFYAGSLPSGSPAGEALERLTPEEKQHLVNLYDGEVAFTNYLLWYTLDLLRYFSETEDTLSDALICVAGISGQNIGSDIREEWGQGGTTDGSLGVPLLLRHPRSLTGRRVLESNVSLEDVGPTLIDWFRLDGLSEWQGRSLLGLTDRKPRIAFEQGPSCSYDPRSDMVTVRGDVWRLTVPLASLGAPGEPLPPNAVVTPVLSLRHLPEAYEPSVALALVESLRAWVGGQRKGAQ